MRHNGKDPAIEAALLRAQESDRRASLNADHIFIGLASQIYANLVAQEYAYARQKAMEQLGYGEEITQMPISYGLAVNCAITSAQAFMAGLGIGKQ